MKINPTKTMAMLFAITIALLWMTGCTLLGTDQEPTPVTPQQIAVFLPEPEDEFRKESQDILLKEAGRLLSEQNLELLLLPSQDSEAQKKQIEEQLENNLAGVILWPHEGETIRADAQAILQLGIPLVVYGQEIPLLTPSAMFLLEEAAIGQKAGKQYNKFFKEELQAGEEVLLLEFQGAQPQVALQRSAGFLETADSNLQIMKRFPGLDSTLAARNQMEEWLSKASVDEVEGIRGIYTHDDTLAFGVLEAIANYSGDADLQIRLISGVGGRRENLDNFTSAFDDFGIDQFTLNQSPRNVLLAVDAMVSLLATGEVPEGRTVTRIKANIITRGNLDQYRESQEYLDRYASM